MTNRGDNLRRIREANQMTIADLAEELGITAHTLNRLESNEISFPASMWKRTAEILAVDFDVLYKGDAPPPHLSKSKIPEWAAPIVHAVQLLSLCAGGALVLVSFVTLAYVLLLLLLRLL